MSLEGVNAKQVTYPKGSYIFKKDEFTRDLYIIHTGKVRIYKQIGMRTIFLTELTKGGVFGESAAIDGGPRSATVQALEDTEVFVISPPEFKQKTANVPDWFWKIVRILIQRLKETDERIEKNSPGSSEYNIVLLFSYLVACSAKEEGKSRYLMLNATQEEIVQLLRIHSKDVGDVFESLKDKGVVDIKGDRILISDSKKIDETLQELEKKLTASNSI